MTMGWLAWVAAHAAPMHWERLPFPEGIGGEPVAIRDVVATEGAVVARDVTGAFHAWRAGWTRIADATPASAAPGTFTVADDGAVWVAQRQPAIVQRFDGVWGPPEPLDLSYLTSIAPDGDGLWVAALFGGLMHRGTDGTWTEVPGPDGHLLVVSDPTGGAWVWSHTGELAAVHVADGRIDGAPLPVGARWFAGTVGVDPEGTPWLVTPRGAEPLGGPPLPDVVALDPAGRWGASDTHAVRLATRLRIPLPVDRVDALASGPDGLPWVVHDGILWHGVDEPGPILREGPRSWGIAHLVDASVALAGDVDGDGLDDLIVGSRDGRLVVLRQGPDRFEDVTAAWFDGPPAAYPVAACDVDGDGRDDLLARVPTEDGRPLHLWRGHAGWLEPATRRSGLSDLPAWSNRFDGDVTCADLDGDGDLDLLLATGGATPRHRSVLVVVNRGAGRFTAADMPVLGLSAPRSWVRRVHPADLDGDGILDFVLANNWGRGHGVLLGTDRGHLRDVTRLSGLAGTYQEPWWSWVTDVTGDGVPDVVTAGLLGVHGWAGHGDGTFTNRDGAWGLVPLAEEVAAAVLADLDRDGLPELLVQQGRTWHLRSARDGAWRSLDASLPPDLPDATGAVAMDLEGDGDLDVFVWGDDGQRWLLDTTDAPPPRPPRHRAWPRIAWARPLDWFALGAAALAAVALRLVLRGSGFRGGPGGRIGAAAVASIGLAAWYGALERPPPLRWALHGLGFSPAAVWGLAAAARHRRREARRIGAYRLSRVLGRGATGTVYAAKDPTTGEEVAVKVIDPDLLTGERDRALYRREAELGAAIDDPRVVRILAYGEWTVAEGLRLRPTAYLVLERIHGVSLRDLLLDGPLDPGTACAIVREVCLGLAAIHAAGIIHRDIKPENVALTHDGGVKVMDFGAARRIGSETLGMGRVLGTLAYLAPEQALGRAPTPATDLYACGVVLYECLSGVRPFQEADLSDLLASRRRPPPRPSGVPDALWSLLASLLAPDPAARPPSAATVAEHLAPWATGPIRVAVPARRPAAPDREVFGWTAHAPVLWQVVRLYLRHARQGGAPDRGAFAIGLLAVDDPAPAGHEPTERTDAP